MYIESIYSVMSYNYRLRALYSLKSFFGMFFFSSSSFLLFQWFSLFRRLLRIEIYRRCCGSFIRITTLQTVTFALRDFQFRFFFSFFALLWHGTKMKKKKEKKIESVFEECLWLMGYSCIVAIIHLYLSHSVQLIFGLIAYSQKRNCRLYARCVCLCECVEQFFFIRIGHWTHCVIFICFFRFWRTNWKSFA